MPRVNVTPQIPCKILNGAIAADAADIAFVSCDATNKEEVTLSGGDFLILWNSGATPRTVTINTTADASGRVGDITAYSIGAGEHAMFGPFPVLGFAQTNGKLNFEGSHADLKYAVVSPVGQLFPR